MKHRCGADTGRRGDAAPCGNRTDFGRCHLHGGAPLAFDGQLRMFDRAVPAQERLFAEATIVHYTKGRQL